MKVCIVAPVHRFDDTRVFKKEALSLNKWGYEVVQYSRTPQSQEKLVDGVLIKPVRYNSRYERFIKLIPLFFQLLKEKADIYHLHNPDTIPYVLLLKILGKKVVYDTHEDFSKKIRLRGWIPRSIRMVTAFMVDKAEIIASHFADFTIVTQEIQALKFRNSLLIENAPVYREVQKLASTQIKDSMKLAYLGGISKDRGLAPMLEILSKLNDVIPTRLTLIGSSVNDFYLEEVKNLPIWKQVDYLGPLPQEKAFEKITQSDFGLVTILDTADYRNTSPNKIYEYMMLGVPFIATDFPKWKAQLSEAEVGYFINPTTISEEFIQVLKENRRGSIIHQKLSSNCVEFIEKHFNWDKSQAPLLEQRYKSLFDFKN